MGIIRAHDKGAPSRPPGPDVQPSARGVEWQGMSDAFALDRFVQAQDPMLAQVRRELGEGRKRNHWMWFVFPQLRGLGRSAMAQHYGIGSLAEARAYLAHPVLGPRLVECTELVNR